MEMGTGRVKRNRSLHNDDFVLALERTITVFIRSETKCPILLNLANSGASSRRTRKLDGASLHRPAVGESNFACYGIELRAV